MPSEQDVGASSSIQLATIGSSGEGSGGYSCRYDSGGGSGCNSHDDEEGSNIIAHPDTHCVYLGTSYNIKNGNSWDVYGDIPAFNL